MDFLKENHDSPERFYTFFYDESNNVRVLSLVDGKFNTDKHSNPSPFFILAGIAFKGTSTTSNTMDLITSLKMQPSAKELKFNQVAKGDFLGNLKSNQLHKILVWLLTSDYYIHYSNLNMEYWSLVDIIDDLCMYAKSENLLDYNKGGGLYHFLQYHKNSIYLLFNLKRPLFLSMLERSKYPKIKGKAVGSFIKKLGELAKNQSSPLARTDGKISFSDFQKINSLSKLLKTCRKIESLDMVYEQKEGLLISGFDFFYQSRIKSFKNSKHILDHEYEIEKFLNSMLPLDAELSSIKYSFLDSKDSLEIQVSDVICGLFKNYFTYINRHTLEELREIKKTLNSHQLESLKTLKELIKKSDRECGFFLHYVMSTDDHEKHSFFMFNIDIDSKPPL